VHLEISKKMRKCGSKTTPPRRFVTHEGVTVVDAYATLIFRSELTHTVMADPLTPTHREKVAARRRRRFGNATLHTDRL
jgi:hypothetical protein